MATKKTEYFILNKRSKKALQAAGVENGSVVEQAKLANGDNQIWAVVETKNGARIINKASGKALDVMANGTYNGTWTQVWEDVGSDSQLWKLEAGGRAYKKIKNVMADKLLDVVNMSDDDGAPIQIWEDVGGENQLWQLKPVGETVTKKASPVKKTAAAKKPAEKKETVKKVNEKTAHTAKVTPIIKAVSGAKAGINKTKTAEKK